MGAVLHALSVPDHGGDTLFSDMYAAYDALDEATKEEIDELVAVHDFTQTFGHAMAQGPRQGPGAVPAGAPPRRLHPPGHRKAAPLRQSALRQPHRGA